MSSDDGLVAWINEALDGVGTISTRKMFGGLSLYCEGRIFAMIADDLLWLKSDPESDALWDAAACSRFTFDFGDGKMAGSMNYRRAPDDAYDDADMLRHWASVAIAAAQRAPVKKASAKKAKP